ncbi:DUF5677 domain-containing protein [Solidesulfovibrio sp.]
MNKSIEINEIQDAMLRATTLVRDAVVRVFSENEDKSSQVDIVLKRLFSFFSARSQAVAHLMSFEYAWDAEIVLRSVYETSAKIWFICLHPKDERDNLVDEFINIKLMTHNRKIIRKAELIKLLFQSVGDQDSVDVYEAFKSEEHFPVDDLNKRERKKMEQKWSYSEMINYIELNYPTQVPMNHLSSYLFRYMTSSSLLHADIFALDLMLDRQLRDEEELFCLKYAHFVRIWSDIVWIWFITLKTLRHKFECNDKDESIYAACERFTILSRPLSDGFYASQREFYQEMYRDSIYLTVPPLAGTV